MNDFVLLDVIVNLSEAPEALHKFISLIGIVKFDMKLLPDLCSSGKSGKECIPTMFSNQKSASITIFRAMLL